MKLPTQRAPFFLGTAAALMLTFSTAALYPQLSQAADATPTPTAPSTATATPAAPATGKSMGRQAMGADREALLADALGISTEELQAAYLKAANSALDQAVAQDLLTQTQADNLRQRLESAGTQGFGFRLGSRGMMGMFGSDTFDSETLLADALGITAEELQTAENDAEAAALAEAVTAGQLTQEQADLVTARRAFQEYVRSQQQSFADLVQGAVDAGAITQSQADLLLANQQSSGGRGFGMGSDFGFGMGDRGMGDCGMDGGRGMHGGRGMKDGQNWGRGQNGSQETQPDDSGAQSNSSFVFPSAGL